MGELFGWPEGPEPPSCAALANCGNVLKRLEPRLIIGSPGDGMTDATTGRGAKIERPLSPHLQIYTPLINMVMSILHRLTGVALYAGTLILAAWLMAAASGPDAFAWISGLLATWPGKIVLFGYTWALIHHALGGIRHFIWDFGFGYDLPTVDLLSWGTIVGSAVLTAMVWILVIQALGGL